MRAPEESNCDCARKTLDLIVHARADVRMPFWAYCDCALSLEFVPRMHVIEGKLSRLRAVRKSIRTRGDAQRGIHRGGRGERN